MRTIKCARCGAEVSATSNRQKYCLECKKALKRGRDLEKKREENQNTRSYIWIAYGSKYPYLPVAVADTAEELGRKVGTTGNCVKSIYNKYLHGKTMESRFHKVRVDT